MLKTKEQDEDQLTLFGESRLLEVVANGWDGGGILVGFGYRSRGWMTGGYRIGSSPGGCEPFGFRADETKLSQALELCVRYPLLFGETLLFVLGSMEHMGPELNRVGCELCEAERAKPKRRRITEAFD